MGFTGHLDATSTRTTASVLLGIVGGSLMLICSSTRSHARRMAEALGSVTGGSGRTCPRRQSDRSWCCSILISVSGATNSNVALFCMLAVAGSGLIGPLHLQPRLRCWYDHKSTLENCRALPTKLRKQTSTVPCCPSCSGIEAEEKRLFRPASNPVGALMFPVTIGLRSVMARWRLQAAIRRMIVQAPCSPDPRGARRAPHERRCITDRRSTVRAGPASTVST